MLPDLTCPRSVKLLRQWCDEVSSDPSFLPRLRLIRIFKNEPLNVIEEQKGATEKMSLGTLNSLDEESKSNELEDEDVPDLVMAES